MKKIILAGLTTERNLGDIVIAECVKYLYNEETKNLAIEYISLDLAGYSHLLNEKPLFIRKLHGARNRLLGKLRINIIKRKRRLHSKYYEALIRDASLIIIVGGGMIKYKVQNCWIYLSGIIDSADKLGIPVALNALGVEGYDEYDSKCQCLKEALNKSVVKIITTRDDINTLRNFYIKGNKHITSRRVADPAVFASSVYGVKKDLNSSFVGIGLIRGNIFTDYDIPLQKKEIIQLYIDVLSELDKRNISWKMFTNGLPVDLELAQEIFSGIGKPTEAKNIIVPNTSKELVETIAGFKGVIAARLHACIISYSLEIPAIGLVWNDKLSLFGAQIGYPDRFVHSARFNKEYIVDELEKAIAEGYDLEKMEAYKRTAKDSIKEILKINSITN